MNINYLINTITVYLKTKKLDNKQYYFKYPFFKQQIKFITKLSSSKEDNKFIRQLFNKMYTQGLFYSFKHHKTKLYYFTPHFKYLPKPEFEIINKPRRILRFD